MPYYHKNMIKCERLGCNFKQSQQNKYCGKHQLCVFEDETKYMNKKVCSNYVRGCRAQLELDYKHSRCQECLEKDRKRDKNKRDVVLEKNNANNKVALSTKFCTSCCKELSVDNFIGELSLFTKTCKVCRTDNKLQDSRRDREHRNSTVRNNIIPQFRTYIKGANERKLEFNLTIQEYASLVKKPCCYCGTIQERGFNGLDRKDSSIGYSIENCESCCQICNYMKGPLSVGVFIKRIEHILTYQQIISGLFYPEYFPNHKKCNYCQYKTRAIKNNLEFSITTCDFDNITADSCYICGKENTKLHENGIDRINSKKGYSTDNAKACCAECNYMKIDYDFDDMIQKFVEIYNIHKTSSFENELIRTNRFN